MTSWLARLAILTAVFVAGLVLVARAAPGLRRRMREPAGSPSVFLHEGRSPGTRAVVVCAGDSITHGVVSADYVELLRSRLGPRGYAFVNAGINGNLAWNVLQRLDAVVACDPDVVTLLIGTNDVNATFDEAWEANYRRQQHLPERPTLDWYRRNVAAVLDRLRADTRARIAVLDLPMLGEDLDSEMNARVAEYNAALREVAAGRGVSVLPLHERLVAMLPAGHVPPPYDGRRSLMGMAIAKRFLLRRTWDAISREHGFAVLTDHIHLGERGAAVIADLLAEFVVAVGQGETA